MNQYRNFKADYDKENDSLFLYDPRRNANAAIELGPLVIDFTSKKNVACIEILNASQFLTQATSTSLSKEFLTQLTKTQVRINKQADFFFIHLLLISNKEEHQAALSLPDITQPSPALATT